MVSAGCLDVSEYPFRVSGFETWHNNEKNEVVPVHAMKACGGSRGLAPLSCLDRFTFKRKSPLGTN